MSNLGYQGLSRVKLEKIFFLIVGKIESNSLNLQIKRVRVRMKVS